MNQWVSFDSMYVLERMLNMHSALTLNRWNNSLSLIGSSCPSGVAQNSATETSQLRSAIEAVAAQTKVDHRFILAVVLQESNGCVRIPATNNGVYNPGLMQGI